MKKSIDDQRESEIDTQLNRYFSLLRDANRAWHFGTSDIRGCDDAVGFLNNALRVAIKYIEEGESRLYPSRIGNGILEECSRALERKGDLSGAVGRLTIAAERSERIAKRGYCYPDQILRPRVYAERAIKISLRLSRNELLEGKLDSSLSSISSAEVTADRFGVSKRHKLLIKAHRLTASLFKLLE